MRVFFIILLAFLAALGGSYGGRLLTQSEPHAVNELHVLLYEKLELTLVQHQRLKMLEADYIKRKDQLEQAMRGDNARLAAAIAAEHGYGSAVETAVDQSHQDMGQLQKVTLEHIFAMRSVLNPEQAALYDRAVVKILTESDK